LKRELKRHQTAKPRNLLNVDYLTSYPPTAMAVEDDTKTLEEAKALAKKDPAKAEVAYKSVLAKGPGATEAALKQYETALVGLGELYRDHR
jgi:hypothetical protein